MGCELVGWIKVREGLREGGRGGVTGLSSVARREEGGINKVA